MTTNKGASKATPEKKELGSIVIVKKARTEKNLQAKLDTMVIDIARGTIQLSEVGKKLDAELSKLSKTEATLALLKVKPVSDYANLQLLHDTLLSKVSEESLAADYAVKADKMKGQFFGELNPAQIKVIDTYFALKARKEFEIVRSVRRVLAHVAKRTTEAQPAVPVALQEAAPVMN